MSKAKLQRDIIARWPAIVARAGTDPRAIGMLPASPTLFGKSTKTELGAAVKVSTIVMYMSPATRAFTVAGDSRTLCANAGACAVVCLGFSAGMLAFESSHRAELWKATLFMGDRAAFKELSRFEIDAHIARCERDAMTPAVRFDGSSDHGLGRTMARQFPRAQVYDYTKNLAACDRAAPENYTLAYSISERSNLEALPEGNQWAVVFDIAKGEPLPATYRGRRVVDGDVHDAIFLHPFDVVLGLRFKQAANKSAAAKLAGDFLN